MKKSCLYGFCLLVFLCGGIISADTEMVTTKWGGDAEMIYDTGFMHKLMKHPDGGVCLFDMDLKQNDAPGAGYSEKGVCSDVIWGKNRARKILQLDDPRAYKAWLVIFTYSRGKYPLQFRVNGNETLTWDMKDYKPHYRWTEFSAKWLKKGKNVIELFCPEAESEDEGWELYIARADEFEDGGGAPGNVGKTSFKSTNGGESWKESSFGPLGKTRAEYSVRLSLDRYIRTGWLATPVIDLWKGDSEDFIVPNRTTQKLRRTRHKLQVTIQSEVPEETGIESFMRLGSDPSPFSEKWGPYELIGSGPNPDIEFHGGEFSNRYIQIKAVLVTKNPLKSPVVKSMNLTTELSQFLPVPENIRVVKVDNPPIKYSSINWEWEKWDRPEFEEVRKRENLNELTAGCRTQFEAQVKLLDYATKRFSWVYPNNVYPAWNARDILERIDKVGSGGMCHQFNNLLVGLCTLYGWPARHVNIHAHEICEVWNDEFSKWIYLDASYVNHYIYDRETLVPLNMLELHNKYLEIYYPDRPINWMLDNLGKEFDTEKLSIGRGSLTHHADDSHCGLNLAAFLRVVPRNNWYGKPYPRPLTHGIAWWPWDGYINWYDEKTPRFRQYSRHTDRPRDMWPDMNRVHVHATSAFGKDRVFLHFETYTPNYSHFEIYMDDTGWKEAGEKWTWYLKSGRNTLLVRAVNKFGVTGRPSSIVLNYVDASQSRYDKIN